MISVIIPVKDGGDDLRRCLDGIARQRTDEDVETLIVDSGSRDGSRELAQSRGARVLEVDASGFRHGATRNLAAAQARGDLLVFTTQDAYAADEHWLERLCAPLRTDGDVAGVYGRQLPHADASPPERFAPKGGPRSRPGEETALGRRAGVEEALERRGQRVGV